MKNKYTMYIGIILSIALSCFSMNDIYNIEVKNKLHLIKKYLVNL